MIDLSGQPCAVCGSTSSRILHSTTYPEHGYPGTFTLRRCDGCGLLFNSPRLDGAELAQLYGRNYYFFQRSDRREFNRIVAMYQRTIALIADTTEKRCIDVGCGRGYFPAVLRQLGWDAHGIEISPAASEYAQRKFRLDVFTGRVEQYAGSPQAKQFPLVTAIDVIEHVPSPNDFVAAAAKIVQPGGRLVIDTPNAAAANIARKGVAWKGFNPFHIFLFSIGNLATLLQRHGMSVERSFSYGNQPQGMTLRDRAIGGLRSAGLLPPVVKLYFGVRKLAPSGGAPEPHVAAAVARIKNESPYTSTPDNSAALAANGTGDNIVVIARK